MARIGIIGGTGLNELAQATPSEVEVETRFGPASAPLQTATLNGHELYFLARHGQPHTIAPHRINYRANIQLFRTVAVDALIATNAVGGVAASLAPGEIVFPDQIIDYSYGREHTFVDDAHLEHVDFTHPYDDDLRQRLHSAASSTLDCGLRDGGVYACTQGPRLESAAEIRRLQNDGCDVVGMTGMPEAGLAREAGLRYAAVCLVVNMGAGLSAEPLQEADIVAESERGMKHVVELLRAFLLAF